MTDEATRSVSTSGGHELCTDNDGKLLTRSSSTGDGQNGSVHMGVTNTPTLTQTKRTRSGTMTSISNSTGLRTRGPIPTIYVRKDSQDVPHTGDISLHPASRGSRTVMSNNEVSEEGNSTPPASTSPTRILRRKKRLSLAAIAVGLPVPTTLELGTSHSTQIAIPSSPQSPSRPFLPIIITPPNSPNTDTTPAPAPLRLSVSVPSIRSIHMSPTSSPTSPSAQPLARIGTSKRPYYSVVRQQIKLNNMNDRSSSHPQLSTPPASPASPTFLGMPSSLPTSFGSPSPGGHRRQLVRFGSGEIRSSDAVAETSVNESGKEKVRPVSMSSPSSPGSMPISMSISAHAQPRPPSKKVLSVFDPDGIFGDDDDDDNNMDSDHDEFGSRRNRKRKSKSEKGKGKGREATSKQKPEGGHHFPLSLSLSLRRKRGKALASLSEGSGESMPCLPAIYVGGISVGRGSAISDGAGAGGTEMPMALAASNVDSREVIPARYYDGEKKNGKKILKAKSLVGLSTTPGSNNSASHPDVNGRSRLRSRLREMTSSFFGKGD